MEYGENFTIENLGGNQRKLTGYLRPVNYKDSQGNWQPINTNWQDSGVTERPNIVSASKLMVSVGNDGMRRIHPTREDDVYAEIGAPYIKVGGVWTKVNIGNPTRTANKLSWTTTNANVYIYHAGHYIKLEIELKNGWTPSGGQFAFPVGLNGLTRTGDTLYKNGNPVMILSAPVVYDKDNTEDVRKITSQFTTVNGQPYLLFTLPDLTGMSKPIVDPTLTLQPDATAGKDTFIASVNATTNQGTNVNFNAGEPNTGSNIRRGLIQFDLSTLPSNSVINSATFSVYLINDASDNARTFRVYRMKRSWVEGTGNATITNDGATWNTYDGVNNWTTAGAFDAADCEQTDIGSVAFSASETLNVFKDFPLTPTTKAGLDLGFGWLIKADTELNEGYLFASSDTATAAQRPKLVIVYTLVNNLASLGVG
jgi:hypothetical protein